MKRLVKVWPAGVMEHVPGGGDDYVVEAQGTVCKDGLALLVKAYADADVIALIGGVGVLENDIAYAELLPAYFGAVFPLGPRAKAYFVFQLLVGEPLLEEAPGYEA